MGRPAFQPADLTHPGADQPVESSSGRPFVGCDLGARCRGGVFLGRAVRRGLEPPVVFCAESGDRFVGAAISARRADDAERRASLLLAGPATSVGSGSASWRRPDCTSAVVPVSASAAVSGGASACMSLALVSSAATAACAPTVTAASGGCPVTTSCTGSLPARWTVACRSPAEPSWTSMVVITMLIEKNGPARRTSTRADRSASRLDGSDVNDLAIRSISTPRTYLRTSLLAYQGTDPSHCDGRW